MIWRLCGRMAIVAGKFFVSTNPLADQMSGTNS